MGRISCSIADISVITSDNPRTENPDSIIDMIVGGARGNEDRYVRITDRRQAIKYACSIARPGDVVLLAGKGQETYQMFGDRTIPFDERVVAREVVEELKSEN